MLTFVRIITRVIETALWLPVSFARFVIERLAFNPKLGPLRFVFAAIFSYIAFAMVLVYVVAPVRGMVGQHYASEKLRYDAERWLATAIYDNSGSFVGTFDPRLDSQRDVNYTGSRIEVGDYVANPDHKSIPVRKVPEDYWRCLVYHEDRHLGGLLNPAGIDLFGVLKIPYSTLKRSWRRGRLTFGVGGSTLPMQFARVIYKTPPSTSEGPLDKIGRKLGEWWMAPVIYHELTRDGDDTPLKQWAANHIWLAQRTGGQPLHGVEVTSRIVFNKEAKDLSVAEQFVLASAVNKPIILLQGSERLNEVRLDRWRYITEVRASRCAEQLIEDVEFKKQVLFELVELGGGPPDPHVKPKLLQALDVHAPKLAKRAQANPIIRANALMPAARFGIREEMKQAYGFSWRDYVRGVTTTFDAAENLNFGAGMRKSLKSLNSRYGGRLSPGYTLDPDKVSFDIRSPNVVVVAADHRGRIVRYFEVGETAPYFGSETARDADSGFYLAEREPRMLASVGKMVAAIAISNTRKDTAKTLYVDTQAPSRGLETCARRGKLRRGRKAIVAFACSLNAPLMYRTSRIGQSRVKAIIDKLGFNMPPKNIDGAGTPPSTAAVLGQISGAPRRVHQMAGVVLNSLIGQRGLSVRAPSLIDEFDYINREDALEARRDTRHTVKPAKVIKRGAAPLLKTLLEAPLCYEAYKTSHGTLRSLKDWCARRRPDVRLHFAKTGTQVSEDPNATVDTLIAGGIQFKNGAAYSYVVLVGTGSTREPWARSLHASQVGAPLLRVLLADLSELAKRNPRPTLLPAVSRSRPIAQDGRKRQRRADAGQRRSSDAEPRYWTD